MNRLLVTSKVFMIHYYKSLSTGGFTHTICGEYRADSEFTVLASKETMSFIVQGDQWKISESDDDAFFLANK